MPEHMETKPAVEVMLIELEVSLKAAPEDVFTALTQGITSWWDTEHMSYRQGRMVLEPVINGSLYENWGNGDGAQFGIVTLVETNRLLEIEGTIGMDKPTQGFLRFELVPQNDVTLLKFTHRAFGVMREFALQFYTESWKRMLEVYLPSILQQEQAV